MKYYLDLEFIEGTQEKKIFGISHGKTKPTIDIISIGLVCEDGREFYAVSNEFNFKEAWNRFDLDSGHGDERNFPPKKVYWIRENILKPIWMEMHTNNERYPIYKYPNLHSEFSIESMHNALLMFGKSNKQIAEDIIEFCAAKKSIFETDGLGQEKRARLEDNPVQFYGYFSSYDWTAFAWLFGKMIDLPKGFPWYCFDLKQELDRIANKFNRNDFFTAFDFQNKNLPELTLKEKVAHFKKHVRYPENPKIHHALLDARFNKELHKFLQSFNL